MRTSLIEEKGGPQVGNADLSKLTTVDRLINFFGNTRNLAELSNAVIGIPGQGEIVDLGKPGSIGNRNREFRCREIKTVFAKELHAKIPSQDVALNVIHRVQSNGI